MSKVYNAVGAYIYAGGFTIGMGQNFNMLAHLEDGLFGVKTVKDNFPTLPIYTRPRKWPLQELKQAGCSVCFANPPCAPWSTAGARREVDASQIGDHMQLSRLLLELEPTIWVWESVTQAYTGKETGLSQYITDLAMREGYNVYHFLHDVKFMNLAQQRRRVFTIASKVQIHFDPPDFPMVTMGEVLSQVQEPGDIPKLGPKHAPYIPKTKQGERLRTVYLRENDKPGPGFLVHRGSWDLPSRTHLGGTHIIHPLEDRLLGHRESAAICGYPPEYEFNKRAGNYWQQIARAVTPAAGLYLGKVLKSALDWDLKVTTPQEIEVNFMGIGYRIGDFRMQKEIKVIR